ncbi:hypothetical protein T12_5611 [Trichinella patagoniensis]|uniref:Uncharacterized protein n=1 Tax=Trichinella patagoniensis TaxID=990121 RepID=A0A0V0Z3R9_9BILA|nr:hypothetical protein T12_5611 [Trichinella patagoniensis]
MRVGRQKPTAVLAGGIFELGGKGGFIAAVRRLPQLDLQLATPPSSNGCYKWKRRHLVMTVIAARLGRRTTPPSKRAARNIGSLSGKPYK